MPAKYTSPEAEQKKLWKLEIKQLTKALSKVDSDTLAAVRSSKKELLAAQKHTASLEKKHEQLRARMMGIRVRETAKIDRRLGVLKGRCGL